MMKITFCMFSVKVKKSTVVIGGSRGRRRCTPPSTGSNSFVFPYIFAEKHMHRRLAPRSNGSAPPQREILDPQLVVIMTITVIKLIELITTPIGGKNKWSV